MLIGRPLSIENKDELKLLFYFLGEIPVNQLINSPLREDNHPSFYIFYNPDGKIYYKDFASGEYGDIISLIKSFLQLPTLADAIDVISKANVESKTNSACHRINYIPKKEEYDIKIRIRDLNLEDIEYWETYGVDHKRLKEFGVYPISHYYLMDKDYSQLFSTKSYCYAYTEYYSKFYYKIYRPYSKSVKWTSNIPFSIWDLYNLLPSYGDTVIITKSRKDSMCIMSNSCYPSINMQSETGNPSKEKINDLKKRFKNVLIWYDNDFNKSHNWGRMFASEIAKEHDLIQIEIPDGFEAKDISDFHRDFGKIITKELIKELVENGKQI
jgi:hypothetical protein